MIARGIPHSRAFPLLGMRLLPGAFPPRGAFSLFGALPLLLLPFFMSVLLLGYLLWHVHILMPKKCLIKIFTTFSYHT